MKKMKKFFIPLLLLILLLSSHVGYAQNTINDGGGNVITSWWELISDTYLYPIVSTHNLGDSAARIANGYFTNLDTNTITINTASEGAIIIDVTDTEAFLVRRNSDAGDLFIADTTNFDAQFFGQVEFSPTTVTSTAILVDQNSNHISIDIDSEATSVTGIRADFQNVSGDLFNLGVNSAEKFAIDYAGVVSVINELDMTGASVIIDLNPAQTTTANIIDITPTATIGSSAVWKGLNIDGGALDPSAASAEIYGFYVDLSGVNLTNDPILEGIRIAMPTTYSGEEDHCAFDATGNSSRKVEIIGNFNDALHVDGETHNNYTIPSTALSHFTVHDYVVDASAQVATSETHITDYALADGLAAGDVVAIGVHPNIDVIHQHAGIFTAFGANFAGRYVGSTYTDNIDDVNIFVAATDQIWMGHTAKFDEIEFDLTTVATKDIKAEFYYYKTTTGWTEFFPADDTNGFTQDGSIRFSSGDLTNWDSTGPGEADAGYWIAIKRTRVSTPGTITPDTSKYLEATVYSWDKNGAIVVATVDSGQGAYELYAMDQDVLVASSPTFANLIVSGHTTSSTAQIGGTTNYTAFSSTGAITQGGSATLTLQDGSDFIITANADAGPFVAITGDTMTGNLIIDNTGTSANSPYLSLRGDDGGVEEEAQIQLIQGADPYLRISVDNDNSSPVLTGVIDIKDQVIAFVNDNSTDIGASGANRPKDYFGTGNITIGGNLTTLGIDDNATTTSLTIDADGGIVANRLLQQTAAGLVVEYDAGSKELYAETSGLRFKENIAGFSLNTSSLSDIELKSWTDKESGREEFGYLADDVAKVFPEAVVFDKEGSALGIKLTKLPILLLEEMKVLKAKVDSLESRIEALESGPIIGSVPERIVEPVSFFSKILKFLGISN